MIAGFDRLDRCARNTLVFVIGAASMAHGVNARSAVVSAGQCPRPAAGSVVQEPATVRSEDGALVLDLKMRSETLKDGAKRYCYVLGDGSLAPTLRVKPGDLVSLRLTNEISDPSSRPSGAKHQTGLLRRPPMASDPCQSGAMTSVSTNLHFHGMSLPPICHADEVLMTSIQPTDPAFEYRFRIPIDEPPGLYWYHPHIHGYSSQQVQGGASGALIVEGIERRYPQVAGLPERVLIIRDQALLDPHGVPPASGTGVQNLLDPEGDALNTGTGTGKPAKDLSLNFVPVPYPKYPPAVIQMSPGGRELWRVLNASAVTYLNLVAIFRLATAYVPQTVTVVAIDGVPLDTTLDALHAVKRTQNLAVPPGGRVEFIVQAPAAGTPGVLATRAVNTGTGGENDPNRVLASIVTTADAPPLASAVPAFAGPRVAPTLPWIGNTTPSRVRRLYFSEDPQDSANPNPNAKFYLTVEGQTPAAFDPMSSAPSIVVKQGDVEDWIIENRTPELHAFHIHQIHFRVLESAGLPVNELNMRDTVNVPFYRPGMKEYPSVRLRMDFRDPNIVGTLVYHCHLLDHEDAGMMGSIRVVARDETAPNESSIAPAVVGPMCKSRR